MTMAGDSGADDLSFVAPGIDYSEVAAIDQKRLVTFVNFLLSRMSEHLNAVVNVADEKLSQIDEKMERLETNLLLVEAKLHSISWLQEQLKQNNESTTNNDKPVIVVPPPQTQIQPATINSNIAPPMVIGQTDDHVHTTTNQEPSNDETTTATPVTVVETAVESSLATGATPMRKDPRYEKYFKMLTLGIPLAAVQQKLAMEGVDPSILDNPDAPSDYVPTNESENDEYESESD